MCASRHRHNGGRFILSTLAEGTHTCDTMHANVGLRPAGMAGPAKRGVASAPIDAGGGGQVQDAAVTEEVARGQGFTEQVALGGVAAEVLEDL